MERLMIKETVVLEPFFLHITHEAITIRAPCHQYTNYPTPHPSRQQTSNKQQLSTMQ
jgi:hypothetical protein